MAKTGLRCWNKFNKNKKTQEDFKISNKEITSIIKSGNKVIVSVNQAVIYCQAVLSQAVYCQAVLSQAVFCQAILSQAVFCQAVLSQAVFCQAVNSPSCFFFLPSCS